MVSFEYKLSEAERAHLVGLSAQPGFQVFINILESQVDQFKMDMIGADSAKPDDVMAKHHLAKAAALFYSRVANRVNTEQQIYHGQKQASTVMPDVTEEILK